MIERIAVFGAIASWLILASIRAETAEPTQQFLTEDSVLNHKRHRSLRHVAALGNGDFAVAGDAQTGASPSRSSQILLFSPSTGLRAPMLITGEVNALSSVIGDGFAAAVTVDAPPESDIRAQSRYWPTEIVRFDLEGRAQWGRLFTAKNETKIRALASGKSGSIYAAGHITRTDIRDRLRDRKKRTPYNPFIVFLTRISSSGELAWSKTIEINRDGGLSVAGLARAPDDGIYLAVSDAIIRLDTNGDVLWARELKYGSIWNVVPSEDGIVVGGDVVTQSHAGVDAFAVSLHANGNVRWARTIDLGASDRIEHVAGLPGGGAVLSGFTRRMGPTLEDKVHRMDGWLIMLDAAGSLVHSYAIGGPDDDHVNASASSFHTVLAVGSYQHPNASMRPFIATLNSSVTDVNRPCANIIALTPTINAIEVEVKPVSVRTTDLSLATERFELKTKPLDVSLDALCPQ